jgi:phosphatidylinositol alpha-mannosyltransferase
MKVAMVTQSYYPQLGGVTEHVHWLTQSLRTLGHHVTVITSGPPVTGERDIIRVGRNARFPINGALVNVTIGIGMRRKLAAIYAEGGFDLIHIHSPLEPTLPLAALMASESTSVPVVGTFHMCARVSPSYEVFAGLLNRYARRLDRRIAVSRAAERFASRYFPAEYTVIPNAIDFSRFAESNGAVAEMPRDKVNLLFVGRLDIRKKVPWLISAFKGLSTRNADCRLTIVGTGMTGWICRIAAYPLSGKSIMFTGKVDPGSLPSYYASSDIFCSLPSGGESFGIVLLEAMAAGKPVIASDIPGYREIVTHRVEGLLIAPGDTRSLVEAMAWLAGDPQARQSMGNLGRLKAIRFDRAKIAGNIEHVYRQAVAQPILSRYHESTKHGGIRLS